MKEFFIMNNFINSKFVLEMSEITSNMYRQGWDERNGGNISYLIDEEYVREYFKEDKFIRDINLGFEADPIVRGKYFLVTGTGKYFKNVIKEPSVNLGLVKISSDGKSAHLLWGYDDGGRFTSEFPAHLMSHATRLKVDPKNRVIMHTHPTYTICMGACLPADDVIFTRKLWKSNTEAVVVFPEGIGVLPCMICGTNEIGEATANKMKDYRLVSWTNHGIYGAGSNIDEAFGLIETVEKTAQIYMLTLNHLVNEIPDEVVLGLAKLWNLKMKPGVIEE
jgi:rhamnulose-1-phosphate aldolase